jgi:hypothetical protein
MLVKTSSRVYSYCPDCKRKGIFITGQDCGKCKYCEFEFKADEKEKKSRWFNENFS